MFRIVKKILKINRFAVNDEDFQSNTGKSIISMKVKWGIARKVNARKIPDQQQILPITYPKNSWLFLKWRKEAFFIDFEWKKNPLPGGCLMAKKSTFYQIL